MIDRALRLAGRLSVHDSGESSDILHCGSRVVAEWAEEFSGCQISLRYWIADSEQEDDAIKTRAVEQIMGRADVDWGARYSEVTGYLWTDEDFKVGGHNMIKELTVHNGKYLLLEVEVHADLDEIP